MKQESNMTSHGIEEWVRESSSPTLQVMGRAQYLAAHSSPVNDICDGASITVYHVGIVQALQEAYRYLLSI